MTANIVCIIHYFVMRIDVGLDFFFLGDYES